MSRDARTLADRFRLASGDSHGNVTGLAPAAILDLTSFLETL